MPAQPPLPRPSSEAAAAANEVLRVLLADDTLFLDSASVGQMLSGDSEVANPKRIATSARQSGTIFAIWDGSFYRYPRFQFDVNGKPRERLVELIALLPSDVDGSRRDAALWLYHPDWAFDGRTPAEIFPEDADRVIRTLRRLKGDDE